jgi:hypothetical protein
MNYVSKFYKKGNFYNKTAKTIPVPYMTNPEYPSDQGFSGDLMCCRGRPRAILP